MSELFKYADIIVFLHILGAIIWVGGMIAIRVAVHPIIQSLSQPKERVQTALQISKRLFKLVALFVVVIMITGLLMAIATNGHHLNIAYLFITKEIIWTVMAINYLFMIFRLSKVQKAFSSGDVEGAKRFASIIPNRLLPINIILGIIALYIGVKLRGF